MVNSDSIHLFQSREYYSTIKGNCFRDGKAFSDDFYFYEKCAITGRRMEKYEIRIKNNK